MSIFFLSVSFWLFCFQDGKGEILEGPSTPPIFLPVDCTIDIVSGTIFKQGVLYDVEGIVSSVFDYRV